VSVRLIHAGTLSGGAQFASWTPQEDVVLVGAQLEGGLIDAAIDTNPTGNPQNFSAGINDKMICFWFGSATVSEVGHPRKVFRIPAPKGEPIFFSASNVCMITLAYESAETIAT
jgi:hypothetical protein